VALCGAGWDDQRGRRDVKNKIYDRPDTSLPLPSQSVFMWEYAGGEMRRSSITIAAVLGVK